MWNSDHKIKTVQKFDEFKMLNVKRRCKLNLNTNDNLFLNNNNNNIISIKEEKDVQKFCIQHNNCNCSTPEVRTQTNLLQFIGQFVALCRLYLTKVKSNP